MELTTRRTTKKALRKAEKRRNRLDRHLPESGSTSTPRQHALAPTIRVLTASRQFRFRVVLYLIALMLAEILTTLIDTRLGIIGHALILALLVLQAANDAYRAGPTAGVASRTLEGRRANFLIALALAPLIRIISLAMPLGEFPELTWYGLIAIPLLAATSAVIKACGYSRQELGLRIVWQPRPLAITLVVSLCGIGLGYLEYQLLQPDPVLDNLSPLQVLAAIPILLIGTGFTEELIFRGVLQRAGGELFGNVFGIGYASVLFAILHIGHRSILDIGFVFVVAVAFALIARATHSLVGVTIAHGLTNICLFIVFPHLLGTV